MALGRPPPVRESLTGLIQRAFVVELGIVVALFVGFSAFTITLDSILDPYFLDSDTSLLVVRSVLVLAGIGALSTSYASWRGYSHPVSIPDRAEGWLTGAAMAGTAVLALLPFLLLAVRMDVDVGHVTSTVSNIGGISLNRTLMRIALFVSGMVLLYHGIVQGALQRVVGHERDLAVVTTTLFGGYLVTPSVVTYGTFANGPWLYLWGTRAAVAVLFVLTLGVAVYADERVDDSRMRTLALLPALAVLTLAAVVLTVEAESPGGALVILTRIAVVGVAAYTYDRTESVVTPTLVYATFATVNRVLLRSCYRSSRNLTGVQKSVG